jgi:Cu-Zn family superoxide dismutase
VLAAVLAPFGWAEAAAYGAPGDRPEGGPPGQRSDAHQGVQQLAAGARFMSLGGRPHATAPTYDTDAVPAGASVQVTQRLDEDGMTIRARVRGVRPDRTFGVHVHTAPCGADPQDAGPHYQHRKDSHQPSTDPAFANPRNEVWLDFTTNASGNGSSQTQHPWQFRAGGARSIVLHEHATATADGRAGMAGKRLACFTMPFGPWPTGPAGHDAARVTASAPGRVVQSTSDRVTASAPGRVAASTSGRPAESASDGVTESAPGGRPPR